MASSRRNPGFTLVELLVAMTISLLMVYGLVAAFRTIGDRVADGRAAIELSAQVRSAAHRLRVDLDGVTSPARPWTPAAAGQGYLEIIEGWAEDNPAVPANPPLTFPRLNNVQGDDDDVLMFTSYNRRDPFLGQIGQTTVQSHTAEVIWWTRWSDGNQDGVRDPAEVQICRRTRLVRPDLLGQVINLADTIFPAGPNAGEYSVSPNQLWIQLQQFEQQCDISVRYQLAGGVLRILPNTLSDLSIRQNRYAHRALVIATFDPTSGNETYAFAPATPFPHEVQTSSRLRPSLASVTLATDLSPVSTTLLNRAMSRYVVATQAIGFDVKLYDPLAAVTAETAVVAQQSVALTPSDPGFNPSAGLGLGTYVDLGYNVPRVTGDPRPLALLSAFSNRPIWPNAANNRWTRLTYDVWTLQYEQNGIDEDGNSGADEGINGLDDNGNQVIDDIAERETWPPYPEALRGIQIGLRLYDPDSRQAKQSTVVSHFLPE